MICVEITFEIDPAIAKKDQLRLAINRYSVTQKSIDQLLQANACYEDESAFLEAQQNDDWPSAKMVNQLISQAVQLGASDIHIDPQENDMRIHSGLMDTKNGANITNQNE